MRVGFTIQEWTCPWCLNRRTARMGDGLSVCFNCGHHWRAASPLARRGGPQPANEPLTAFTLGALDAARLAVYRAAVQSGFYTDWPVGRVA